MWRLLLSLAVSGLLGAPALAAASEAAEIWALHGQTTVVAQYHPGFASAYSGRNSLTPTSEGKETVDLTLFGGVRLWPGAELWVNPEVDQGFGLSNTLGLAAFPSGAAFKVGAATPYARLARVLVRQTIPLGGEREPVPAAANQLAGRHTANRLVVTVGKFALTDLLDHNRYADDPRQDFLNWAIFDTGTWDYAADAWGFTYGAVAEWYQHWWTLRTALVDLSKVPNSKTLDARFLDQYQGDVELEARYTLLGHPGTVRLLGFVSHGRMGRYTAATHIAVQTGHPADIAAVRRMHNRLGLSLNVEQPLTEDLGVFFRTGWSQGQYEAFDYTDINQTLSGGVSLAGTRWGRRADTLGLAATMNAASAAAKHFFGAGGLGILVGDGRLAHAHPERILELYYQLAAVAYTTLTVDYQFIDNPAYNADRGPVSVVGIRVHVEF